MSAQPIVTVWQYVDRVEPVLLAPRGDAYHRARALHRTLDERAGTWALETVCGLAAPIATDPALAHLLQREPCGRCWPHPWDQLTVSDTEEEAPPAYSTE